MINTVSGDRTKIEALEKLMKFVLGSEVLTEYSDTEYSFPMWKGIIVLSREEIVFELKCGLKLKERLVGPNGTYTLRIQNCEWKSRSR